MNLMPWNKREQTPEQPEWERVPHGTDAVPKDDGRIGGRKLGRSRSALFIVMVLVSLSVGGLGAWATYTNLVASTQSVSGATSVVAGGEGVIFVAALLVLGRASLGLPVPFIARAVLWVVPALAMGVGAALATTPTQMITQAFGPIAMTGSAESLSYLARSILTFKTGVDTEAQRRNAQTVQRLAYLRARANNHTSKRVQERSKRQSWRVAAKVGRDDAALGKSLLDVQHTQMTDVAHDVLAEMFRIPEQQAVPQAVPAGTHDVPQVTSGEDVELEAGVPGDVPQGASGEQDGTYADDPRLESKLEDFARARGIPCPVRDQVDANGKPVPLTDEQVKMVLQFLRYREHPPTGYRKAGDEMRDEKGLGFTCGQDRIRLAWREILDAEHRLRVEAELSETS